MEDTLSIFCKWKTALFYFANRREPQFNMQKEDDTRDTLDPLDPLDMIDRHILSIHMVQLSPNLFSIVPCVSALPP